VQLFKDGRAVDQFMGALPEAQIRAFLAQHVSRASDLLLDQARQAMAEADLNRAEGLIERAQRDDPDNSRVFIAQVELKAAAGDAKAALELLEHTPLDLANDPALSALRGRLGFSAAVADAPSATALQATLDNEPNNSEARYQLAAHQVLTGDYQAALENLLTLLKRDRQYGEDAARKGMVAIFELLGSNDALVARYRAKMLSSLY
jgi:putative thioredoxin